MLICKILLNKDLASRKVEKRGFLALQMYANMPACLQASTLGCFPYGCLNSSYAASRLWLRSAEYPFKKRSSKPSKPGRRSPSRETPTRSINSRSEEHTSELQS